MPSAPDLNYCLNLLEGYDFVDEDTHPNDDEGHGTHVTGTIAQSTNNGYGVAGVAFSANIMPDQKFWDSSGSGTYADIAEGIDHAADRRARVINMSLGGSSGSITLEQAVAYAHGKNVVIVCASGNDGSATSVSYPAAYDAYCIAVGATRYDGAKAYYSGRGCVSGPDGAGRSISTSIRTMTEIRMASSRRPLAPIIKLLVSTSIRGLPWPHPMSAEQRPYYCPIVPI